VVVQVFMINNVIKHIESSTTKKRSIHVSTLNILYFYLHNVDIIFPGLKIVDQKLAYSV